MYRFLIRFISCCILLTTVTCLNAQSSPSENKTAVVELQNGTRVQGEIIKWVPGDSIRLAFAWGDTISFYESQIKRIEQNLLPSQNHIPYTFNEKGFYCSLQLNFINGNEGNRAQGSMGLGGNISAGHRFNRYFAVGGGIGYDRFIWDSGENLVPLFTEFTGFLNESNTSLFYNFKIGYALASKNDVFGITEARGGFMLNPNLGIRWDTGTVKYLLGIGYKFQDAQFTYASPWQANDISIQDLYYQRLTLSLGLTI
jgi:hypothetical protein